MPFYHYIALTNTPSLSISMFFWLFCHFLPFFPMCENASIISKNTYLTNATNRDHLLNDATNRDHLLNDTTTYLTMR
jgi:hypothetical protein